MSDTQAKIHQLFTNLDIFLTEKNRRYGDSAINPIKIFSKVEPENSICIRIDDKLSRIANSTEFRKNDLTDLIGYLALLMIQKGWTDFKDLID